jgi:formate dehydrogenase subunit delta
MANQIATFFASQGEERAVPQITAHIRQFWDPRMRKQILTLFAKGGEGLEPLAWAAIAKLES